MGPTDTPRRPEVIPGVATSCDGCRWSSRAGCTATGCWPRLQPAPAAPATRIRPVRIKKGCKKTWKNC
jgi:hypothetical protein